ncbi:MAG: DUF99 family protein [Myxococcales bacterium]
MKAITNIIGFDDAPFERASREDVRVVGVVCARTRLDGVVCTWVARNGDDATVRLAEAIERSQFVGYARAVLLQGIALAGFNVVDIRALSERLGLPVVVVARRMPNFASIRAALDAIGIDPEDKWRCMQRAGTPAPLRGLWVQHAGVTRDAAERMLEATTLHGKIPEALRLAHLIAGGITRGTSRGRA